MRIVPPALYYADWNPVAQLTHAGVEQDDVEDQGFAGNRRFAARGNPLVGSVRFHDHIGIHPHGPFVPFCVNLNLS